MNKSYNYNGVDYILPTVHLLAENGIGQSEYAARQCYNSFDKSENEAVQELNKLVKEGSITAINAQIPLLQNVRNSDLLKQLSFVHFHESTLEHSVISFLLTDFSRGVLQELARHRIASYSVMSTRYTLANLINAYTAGVITGEDNFLDEVLKYDMLVTPENDYNRIEIVGIQRKLDYQLKKIGQEAYLNLTVAKSVREQLPQCIEQGMNYYEVLQVLNSKDKRNVGDSFKHIITDNFKVNAVMTINLRSYKNFLQLRDSGAAWFQIDKLAKEMKSVTPQKYLDLIIKPKKVEKPLKEQIKELKMKLLDLENKAKEGAE